MKKKFLLFFLLISAGLFNHPVQALSSNDSIQNQLNLLLDQWHRDAADGNHAAYIGAMTGDGVFIGTDATECWTTPEFGVWSKPFFDRKRTWNFKPVSRNIHPAENNSVAWFDELLYTQMGICRGSGVLQKVNGQWKIAQYVLSATIPNEIMKKVTALKSAADSSLMLKSIFDKNELTGTMLIVDASDGRAFGYNQSRWDSGYLPASTFKIPNTLIGLETGVIDTGYVFKWRGEKRRLPQWEKDLTLQEAFRVSCVPCFQELARKTGSDRMNGYLEKLKYPGMDVRSGNIDLFWLEGNSRITPRQQVEFLRRLHEENLPLKKSVMEAMKRIMVVETTPDYILSGKTGWAVRNGNNYGWFVGYIETKGKVFYMATLVEPKDQKQVDDFAAARKLVIMGVFELLGLIPVRK